MSSSVETTYTVTLDVLNAGSCPGTVSHTIIIGPEFTFFIPNAFSPNDDKINDVIDFSKYQFSSLQIQIFNRWGQEVFKTTDRASLE